MTYDGAGHGFLRSGADPGASAADRAAAEQAWVRWLAILAELTPTAVDGATWGRVKAE